MATRGAATAAAAAALLLLLLPALASAQVIRVRQPFRTLMSAPEYAKQRDLLILALQHLQQMDADDPESFYQIGSIHGMPAAPYAGVENVTSPYEPNSTRWLGYCDHAGVIFPTWHRPYVLQLELSIRRAAMRIAEQFEFQFGLNVYKEAAETLSWPYWDWAANEPHPAELTDLTILVRVPPRMKWQRIANPFYSYTFQKETSSGASYTESQEIPFWSPAGSPTYRYPYVDNSTNTGYMSNQTGQIDTYNNMYNLTHDWVMNLFNINSWTCFADRGSQLSTPFCPLQSLESVHNWVHLYIGGCELRGESVYVCVRVCACVRVCVHVMAA
uniref:Tyrosinase copper-binding domain-containing protein n=1 Tax=Chlamydomonas euryale TaxID=1486919 RepID=A0A6U2JLQ7_9CHLO